MNDQTIIDLLLQFVLLAIYGTSLIHVYRRERQVNPSRRAGTPVSVTLMVAVVLWPLGYFVWLFFGNRNPTQWDRAEAEKWARKRLHPDEEEVSKSSDQTTTPDRNRTIRKWLRWLPLVVILECCTLAVIWHFLGLPPSFCLCSVVGMEDPDWFFALWDGRCYEDYRQWWWGIGRTAFSFCLFPLIFSFPLQRLTRTAIERIKGRDGTTRVGLFRLFGLWCGAVLLLTIPSLCLLGFQLVDYLDITIRY